MLSKLLALALICAASGAAAESLTLAHHYKVAGQGSDGSKYTGTVTLDVVSDTTFTIHWDLGGGSTYEGFGMRRNDMLAASFSNGKSTGVVMYQVEGDGLDGTWTFKGENGTGVEHLTPAD